ncbi:MAG: hypothetical protein D6762_01030 [Candidatus Neomarinimicrobiota bacterium]|nr:MAG: hypothetical protein D6762_01030 [Candidatus Neomarinimicrobiota bacterium]
MEQFTQELQQLLHDRMHGSEWLTRRLIRSIQSLCQRRPAGEPLPEEFWTALHHLRQAWTSFRSPLMLMDTLISVRTKPAETVADVLQQVLTQKDTTLTRLRQAFLKIGPRNRTLLLHSHSDTILRVLTALPEEDRPSLLFQTISYPGEEGLRSARSLSKAGYAVEVLPDTAVGNKLTEVDWLVLGADGLGTTHFTNKVGSLVLALLAKAVHLPLYVLAEAAKTVPEPCPPIRLTYSARDLWPEAPDGILLSGGLLEPVPNQLVTEFLTA